MTTTLEQLSEIASEQMVIIENTCKTALMSLEQSSVVLCKQLKRIEEHQRNIRSLASERGVIKRLDKLNTSMSASELEEIGSEIEKITDMMVAQSLLAESEMKSLIMRMKEQDRVLMHSISGIMEEITIAAEKIKKEINKGETL